MRSRFEVAVVGGGAAGLTAAIHAARRGAATVVCERLSRPGRKILATGGGRCNLSNEDLSPARYSSSGRPLAAAILSKFGADDVRCFFEGLGLELQVEGGRLFPVTNQASSVLRVLEIEARQLGITLELGFEAVDIKADGPLFIVTAGDGRRVAAGRVVVAGGGKAYPALGSNGSAYLLARRFGHTLVPPVPSAVPLLSKDRMCHLLQGQKVRAKATAVIDGRNRESAAGDIVFAQYGLSGTAVLDVSESVSVAINRQGRSAARIVLDLVPFMNRSVLAARLLKRLRAGWAESELGAGILPEKFATVLTAMLQTGGRAGGPPGIAGALAAALKARSFSIHGTRGWNEAEFTCGGLATDEVEPHTLESKLHPGLFFAGEILDVQGPRGGYNLGWAWASGAVAGHGP